MAELCQVGVELCPDDRGESVGPEGPGIGDWEIITREEVVSQGDEIVTGLTIAAADILGRGTAVRSIAVGVEVSFPETTGLGERER